MNEPHESGAILIFFSVENWGGRKFRLSVWPLPTNKAASLRDVDFEEERKDALGISSWMPWNEDDDDSVHSVRRHRLACLVLGLALHSGTIPRQGIDLGTVKVWAS